MPWPKGKSRSEQTKRKISAALKGSNHPNYGKPMSEEQKRKISTARLGYQIPLEIRQKISATLSGRPKSIIHKKNIAKAIRLSYVGRKHIFYGKPRSKETKLRISIALRGKRFSEEHISNLSKALRGKGHSEEWRKEHSRRMKGNNNPMRRPEIAEKLGKAISGENHWNWRGGSSFEPHGIEFNSVLRARIRKRDNCICQRCGRTEKEEQIRVDRVLCIHHIDYNKKNNTEDNLITLCNACNTTVNSDRDSWQEYFNILVRKRVCVCC